MGNRNNRPGLQHQASVPVISISNTPSAVPGRTGRRASEFKPRQTPDVHGNSLLNPVGESSARITRRRWSSTAVGTSRNNTMKPKRLAPRQRNLVIKAWNKSVKSKVGKDIFIAIFQEDEELKTLFGISPAVKGKKLRSDARFIAHTDIFIDTFDYVIQNLDDISVVIENAEQLGRKHALMNIENFKPEYWNVFSECIIDVVSLNADKETQIAWRQLVLTLIFYMKLGYERELLRISRTMSQKACSSSGVSATSDIPVL